MCTGVFWVFFCWVWFFFENKIWYPLFKAIFETMWFKDEERTPHNAILTFLIDLTFIKIQRSNNTVFVLKRLIKNKSWKNTLMMTKVCWRGEGVGKRHTCYILKTITHFNISVWCILNESPRYQLSRAVFTLLPRRHEKT